MTVKELIDVLNTMPKNLPVVTLDGMPIDKVEIADDRTIQGEKEVVVY